MITTLLDRLEAVKGGHGRWIARCPAHADRSPSLSIRECDDGRILVHCHAGCSPADIMSAVGLSMTDLFPDGPLYHKAKGVLRRNERRAYYEAVVEIAIADIEAGQRMTREALELLREARAWLKNHPETEDWK